MPMPSTITRAWARTSGGSRRLQASHSHRPIAPNTWRQGQTSTICMAVRNQEGSTTA
jgi:hypothetical protein